MLATPGARFCESFKTAGLDPFLPFKFAPMTGRNGQGQSLGDRAANEFAGHNAILLNV